MKTKTTKILYYVSTVILSASMLMGGFFDATQNPMATEGLRLLGYPAYFAIIIGVAKILGVIGIWQKNVPFLREWAYAGFFFDTLGALISHLVVGPSSGPFAPALISLIIVLISYITFRKLRLS